MAMFLINSSLFLYEDWNKASRLTIPTPDHSYSLIYTLGLQGKGEEVSIFNDQLVAGSLSMTSVRIG